MSHTLNLSSSVDLYVICDDPLQICFFKKSCHSKLFVNKSMVFTKLMNGVPQVKEEYVVQASLPNEALFFIDSYDMWYGDIPSYL